jgi:hypothetical protein
MCYCRHRWHRTLHMEVMFRSDDQAVSCQQARAFSGARAAKPCHSPFTQPARDMTASRRIDIGAARTVSFQRCAKKSFARAGRRNYGEVRFAPRPSVIDCFWLATHGANFLLHGVIHGVIHSLERSGVTLDVLMVCLARMCRHHPPEIRVGAAPGDNTVVCASPRLHWALWTASRGGSPVSSASQARLLKPRGAAGARADEKEVTAVYCCTFS